MGFGYMGKIMWVDLSTGAITFEDLPDSFYEQVLSGAGLAARILYNRIPAEADPLGPDNVLGFVSGLLTGTGTLFSGRWMVAGKSPLTGGYGEANCGGNFSPAIKRCGVDGIFFTGASETPVYLKVIKGNAELVDATHLWGKDAVDAESALIEESGVKSARAAVIGQTGSGKRTEQRIQQMVQNGPWGRQISRSWSCQPAVSVPSRFTHADGLYRRSDSNYFRTIRNHRNQCSQLGKR